MRCVIMQPNYIPWSGYFNLIWNSDVFVFLDHVQYTKNEWINRNRIKTKDGWVYLTIPIQTSGKLYQSIAQAEIDNKIDWRGKHWRSLLMNYAKAPYFKEISALCEDVYSQEWKSIGELNIYFIKKILDFLNIKKKILISSEMDFTGHKTDLVIDICKKVQADEYLSPARASVYIEEEKFKQNNIKLIYQTYSDNHPVYPQLGGNFISHLSILDLLFNCGQESLNYINQYEKQPNQ